MTSKPGPPAFYLTDRDKAILAQTDEQYHLLTWDDVKTIIGHNELEKLTRLPSSLRAYLTWSAQIKAEYGSMANFLLRERLQWTPLSSSNVSSGPIFACKNQTPFADPADYKILRNDWPYGLADGIVHICVWLKTRLPVSAKTGDLTEEGKQIVDQFVRTEFDRKLGVEGRDKVLWFKNWTGLQSVRGLEHIHVLVRHIDSEKLDQIIASPFTDGCEKVDGDFNIDK